MKHAILILDRPESEKSPVWDEWQHNRSLLQKELRQASGSQQLDEGTWLFELEHGLSTFSAALRQAGQSPYPYRVLFFDEKPKWIVTAPKATVTA